MVRKILAVLFKELQITDVDPGYCASDFAGASVLLKDFATDMTSKRYSEAMAGLSRGLSSLSRAVSDCDTPEVQQKIDTLATSVRWANISTSAFDRSVKIFVDASELWDDLVALAAAIESNDPGAVGKKLGQLLDAWTAVEGGCKDREHVCKLVDGLLRVLQIGASDARPCQTALAPAIANLTAVAKAFDAKDYKKSVLQLASTLDGVALMVTHDACGLKPLADAIGNLGGKLHAAVIKVEGSDVTRIMVGSADVYPELYATVADIRKGDFADAGVQMGALLSQLRASGCRTKACIITEGLLGTLQVGFADFTQCRQDLDSTWGSFENFFRDVKMKNWQAALPMLADVLGKLSSAMSDCGVEQVGSVLGNAAKRLHKDSLATEIGVAVQLLAAGADVTTDIQKILLDFDNRQWASLGRDLGGLSDWITSKTQCHSLVCRLVEGVLTEAQIGLTNLKPCEDKLREGETDFTAGAASWESGDKRSAVKSLAEGLNALSQGVRSCGLSEQLHWLEQEANVFGLGNLTVLEKADALIVHGSDFYGEVFGAIQDLQNHDYRAAAGKLTTVTKELAEWSGSHLCKSSICYVVNGAMQYLAEQSTDFKKCKADFGDAWADFHHGFHALSRRHHAFSGFSNSTRNVSAGLHDLSRGLKSLADGVGDCDLPQLAETLARLSAKFLMKPEFEWMGEFLQIVIDGVDIEMDLAIALEDFARHDWPGFGYNLVKLAKTLLKSGVHLDEPSIVI